MSKKNQLTNAQRVWLYSHALHYDRLVLYEIATALDLGKMSTQPNSPTEPMRKTAQRCGLTRIGFCAILRRLVKSGELIIHSGRGRGNYNRYELNKELLTRSKS